MALIAVTDINHGVAEEDGSAKHHYINSGDEVDEGLFTDEQLDALRKAGAVEESAQLDEVQALRKQVEELTLELRAKESETAGKDNVVTGARAVDQTALDPLRGVPAGAEVETDDKGNVVVKDEDKAKSPEKTTAEAKQTPGQTGTVAPNKPAQG